MQCADNDDDEQLVLPESKIKHMQIISRHY